MTVHDWQQHVTSKGIKQNDAVMMLNDAKAEIERLRAALQPFADAAQYVDSPLYTAGRFVGGLNTVEHYHNARRVLGEATS